VNHYTFAFDTARDERVRSSVLYMLHSGWSDREKIELFMEVYRQPGEMPESYASTTQQNLIAGPAARLFAERLIETIFQHPYEPDASDRLLDLVSDVHWGMGREQPELRGIAIQALHRAAQNRDRRLPPRLVLEADQRLSEMREKRVIP
jgi:hypothetical protein